MEHITPQDSKYQIISMMDLRKNIGAIINEVVYKKKVYLIERRGKPLCILDVYSDSVDSAGQSTPAYNVSAERLFGCLKNTASTPQDWISGENQTEQDYQTRMEQLWDTEKK